MIEKLTLAMSVIVLALSINFLWSILTFLKLINKKNYKTYEKKKIDFNHTHKLPREISVDECELCQDSHVLQALCAYISTMFPVKR